MSDPTTVAARRSAMIAANNVLAASVADFTKDLGDRQGRIFLTDSGYEMYVNVGGKCIPIKSPEFYDIRGTVK